MKEELDKIKKEATLVCYRSSGLGKSPSEFGMFVDEEYNLFKYTFTYRDSVLNKRLLKILNKEDIVKLNRFIEEIIDKQFDDIMVMDAKFTIEMNYKGRKKIINHYHPKDDLCVFTRCERLLESFYLPSDEELKNLKKIELHLHLDGSVRPETLYELSKSKEDYNSFLEKVHTDKHCKDLNEYLEKFDLPLKVMQKGKNITRIVKELCEDLEHDHVLYAEIRFSPLLHTKGLLSLERIVKSALKGVRDSKVKVNLILCCMRGRSFRENKKVVDLAYKYRNKGVVAIDLAGAEGLYKTEEYADLFSYARKLGVLFTIHAGEARGKEEIEKAVAFGAKRIGHGIHLESDEKLMKKIKKNGIILEICPTSNVQTKAVRAISHHPIYDYYQEGIKTTINTDNRTVSKITLFDEYRLLRDTFKFALEDFKKMNEYAIDGAFLNEEEKQILKKKLGE